MGHILPSIYWGPKGKRGIIDTGKTVEFWIYNKKNVDKPIIEQLRGASATRFLEVAVPAASGVSLRFRQGKSYHIDWLHHLHFVSIEPDIWVDSDELCVWLYMEERTYDSIFCDNAPSVTLNKKEHVRHLLGRVPRNSDIHKCLLKHSVEFGRITKIQLKPFINLKVTFPYGPYKFTNEGKLILNEHPPLNNNERFNQLIIGEE